MVALCGGRRDLLSGRVVGIGIYRAVVPNILLSGEGRLVRHIFAIPQLTVGEIVDRGGINNDQARRGNSTTKDESREPRAKAAIPFNL